MSLGEQIQATIQVFRETLPTEVNGLIEQGAGEISALNIIENALKVGDKAPEFNLNNYDGAPRNLQGYLQDGPVVLTFYRGLWCPYCNLQLATYNKHLQEIKNAGANLVAVSGESAEGANVVLNSQMPQEMKESIVKAPDFDVLYDENAQLGRAFGLTFKLPESHEKLMTEMMGVDLEKAVGNDEFIFSDPATYIVGTDGIIKWAFIPNNYRKRAEAETIIEELKKLKG